MHLILLALGIAAILAGAVMIGYGIPINEFGLGNTLIGAGTTAIAGGLVVVALAIAVRQLTRIAAQLEGVEPAAAPVVAADAEPPGWVAPIPVAVVPVPGSAAMRGPAAAEEKLDQPRQPDLPSAPREPSLREPPMREPLLREPPPAREPPAPPRVAARARGGEQSTAGNAGAESAGAMRPARSSRGEIPVVLSPRERTVDRPAEPASAEPRGQPAVSILKAGVIDGMAYTIYSDGSIEAELPQGTMRFTTFEDLRVYLADAS